MFHKKYALVLFLILLNFHVKQAREINKSQKYNHEDFLLNESIAGNGKPAETSQEPTSIFQASDFPALNSNGKGDSNGKRDYVAANWPKTQSATSQTNTHLTSSTKLPPKRDYVAPQVTTKNPISNKPTQSTTIPQTSSTSGKRDYVAPVSPSTATSSTTKTPPTKVTTGKRDYVASNWPALPSSGVTAPPNKNSSPSTKPSFSAAVSGNKVSTASPAVINKPSGSITTKPVVPTRTPVLPSTLVSNNKHNNGKKDGPSDEEIQILSEELLRKDVNNAAKYITVNYQEKTTSQSKEDKAPASLFTVPENVWNMPTIQKFLPLLDNYEWDTILNEHVTPQERIEENDFMDTIMSTSVIRHLLNFLKNKGYVTPDPKQQRDFLKQMWFSLYSRGKGKISSSGFEHIFVSELKNGEVSGLHNWIYFAKQEAANKVNYLGYLKYSQFDKGAVLKLHFNQQGVDKPVDTMFIGTSPELEIALYTLCFVTRADNDCNLKLGGKNIGVITHTFRYRSKNLIGSAYPTILA